MLSTFKTAVTQFFLSRTLNAALPFAVLALTLWKGGWRERLIALIGTLEWLLDVLVPIPWIPSTRVERGVRGLVCDLILLAVCLAALRRARRYWMILAAGLALLSLALDALFLMTPSMSPYPYVRADILISYVLDGVLIWASLTASRSPGSLRSGLEDG